jgi:uncharacterized protein
MTIDPSSQEFQAHHPEPGSFASVSATPPQEIRTDLVVVREGLVPVQTLGPPHPGFWGAVGWSIAFSLGTQIAGGIVGILVLLVLVNRSGNEGSLRTLKSMLEAPEMVTATICAFFCAEFLAISMPLGLIRLTAGREWRRQIALRLPSWTHLILAVLLLPSTVILANGCYVLIKQIVPDVFGELGLGDVEAAMTTIAQWPLEVAILLIGVGPGIGEELFCRAFLGRGLVGRYGYVAGVVMTSIFFGLIHIEPRQGLFAVLVGSILHFTYLTTRSILIPVLLHFMNNSFAVIAPQIEFLRSIDNSEGLSWMVYLNALVVLVLVLVTLYRCRARLQSPGGTPDWTPNYPGVELPPTTSLTTISHPNPGWLEVVLIMVSFGGLATQLVLLGRNAG